MLGMATVLDSIEEIAKIAAQITRLPQPKDAALRKFA